MASKKPKMKQYKVLIECYSAKHDTMYSPGEVVTGDDFPASVIANWLKIEVLAEVKHGNGKK